MDTGASSYAGLFGFAIGTLRDIGVEGGSVKGASDVGGLAGVSYGAIGDAYATSAITVERRLLCWRAGRAESGGTISEAYATGAVSGSGSEVGGLVGYSSGTINDAYATGAVTAGSSGTDIGGLVGYSFGTISDVYATGAVSGNDTVGGLVGRQYSGTISSAYATGAVSGSGSDVGGLVGGSGGTISNAYWDTGTSGQSSSGGGTAQTTAHAARGSLPSGFDSSVWGTGTGLYPYLKSFFPNGAQAVSGIAYGGDGTVLAFSTAGTNTVSVDAGGALVGQTNINSANGYYYVLMPAGSIANGTDLLVSLPTDASTGAVNAATLATSTHTSGTPGQGGINLYGGFLSERTGATTLSAAPSLASVQTAANTAAGTDSTASAIVNAITAPGYLTTGSSFTVDQSYSGSGFLVTTGTGDPITVSNDVTISDGGALALLSGGALAIDAAVTAKGSTSVSLAYDSASATNLSFGLTSTGFTGSLGFANADGSTAISSQGGTLSINGTSYTLIYTMDQFDAIDATSAVDGSTITGYGPGLAGHYALASSLDASGTSYTDALVGTGDCEQHHRVLPASSPASVIPSRT